MWLNTTKTCPNKNVLRHSEASVLATSGHTRSMTAVSLMVCGSGPLGGVIVASAEQRKRKINLCA